MNPLFRTREKKKKKKKKKKKEERNHTLADDALQHIALVGIIRFLARAIAILKVVRVHIMVWRSVFWGVSFGRSLAALSAVAAKIALAVHVEQRVALVAELAARKAQQPANLAVLALERIQHVRQPNHWRVLFFVGKGRHAFPQNEKDKDHAKTRQKKPPTLT